MAASMVDINSDLGEGFGAWRLGDDDATLRSVTSANIACGFHAGDAAIMRRLCADAAAAGVRIGAHVGYQDLAGFGRRALEVEPARLTDEILYQLGALDSFARVAGDRIRYVKPHGALYSRVMDDDVQAAAVVDAVRLFDPGLAVLGLPGSVLLATAGEAGLVTVPEAFADRAYLPNGRLAPRGLGGALITDPETAAERALAIVTAGQVGDIHGEPFTVWARSLCIHGDTPGAAQIARAVRSRLTDAGVRLEAFAS